MNIPETFKNKIAGAFGEEGIKWLETIASRVQICVEKWNLKIDAPVTNLSYNYVLNAIDLYGNPVILKLGIPGSDFQNEIRALQAYNGIGCARLIKADASRGAILQMRLIPGKMLYVEDEISSIKHFIQVWKSIRCPLQLLSGLSSEIDTYPDENKAVIRRISKYIIHFDEQEELFLTPSYFVWPHLFVKRDKPIGINYSVMENQLETAKPMSPEDLIKFSRAMGDFTRLQIVKYLAEKSRSTRELAGLRGQFPNI